MALWQWSTTPANNATAGAINWAEGMLPGQVDDSARQMMADVAQWYQTPEWLNYGLTPTYVSATQFTVTGNQTATYSVGRRVRAFVTAGAIYGTVSSSVFTSLTTVAVTWDAGNLDSGLSEVDVGILNASNPSISSLPALTITNSNGSYSGLLKLIGSSGYSPSFRSNGAASQLEILNSAGSGVNLLLTDAGNLTATGNVTANSDERLKTNWRGMSPHFVDKLAAVRSGTYERTDYDAKQVGVSAQSLQKIMPEAVIANEDSGYLSVAYGNAALVAAIELAKEVVALRNRVAELESHK